MRIGLFTDTFPPDLNGVANSTHILFQQLKAHGHDVYVVCTRKGTGWAQWNESHDVLRLAGVKFKHLYGYAVTTPWHVNALNEIRALNLDVIHVQTEFGVGIFARTCSRTLGIPLVSTYHTSYEDYTHYINILNSDRLDERMKSAVGWFSKFMSDTCVEVIAPSKKTHDLLLSYHVNSDINIVPTGLDLNQFHPSNQPPGKTAEIRRAYGYTADERLVIYVGRIAEEKALDLVIDGFHLAEAEGCKLHLLIVGGGPDMERLQKYTEEKNMHSVTLAGPKPADEVADYYRSADFFVSASLSETQGMTFVEAMAAGLPLLARKDSVLDELLVDGKTGWYFSDASDLAKKLFQLEQLPEEQLKAMKEAALQQIKPLSAEVFYEKALQVYEKAINSYRNMLVVEDVQVKQDIVQVYLQDMQGRTREDIRLLMSLDDYYNEGIRKGTRLSAARIDEIQKKQAGALAWRQILRRIAVKDRTRKEVYDWLTKKTSCSIETINSIVEKLEEKGYVDDERYCEENLTRMKNSLYGEDRMIRTLRKKGISLELIKRKLQEQPVEELEQAKRYARKAASSISDTSLRMKQRKLKNKLLANGYSPDVADEVTASFDWEHDNAKELDSLRKCAHKARKRYLRKYSGTKLRNTVYRYCSAQGYQPEDIYVILDEMEWNEDDKDQGI